MPSPLLTAPQLSALPGAGVQRLGQHAVRGALLGYVGTTGNAPKDTPHLHFAIVEVTEPGRWWKGTALDPWAAFSR